MQKRGVDTYRKSAERVVVGAAKFLASLGVLGAVLGPLFLSKMINYANADVCLIKNLGSRPPRRRFAGPE